MSGQILIGQANAKVELNPRMANRHGLIAGATGTGKTVTLQGLAESFSELGVPVFLADVKGDLSGISQSGKEHPKIAERVTAMGLSEFAFTGYPVTFWDLFGKQGHPVRTTITDMGPLLLAPKSSPGVLPAISSARPGQIWSAMALALLTRPWPS